jgi:hypothetical protein
MNLQTIGYCNLKWKLLLDYPAVYLLYHMTVTMDKIVDHLFILEVKV